MRLHMTGTNYTTQWENQIFESKDVGGKLPSDGLTRLDASVRLQTPDNGRNKDLMSTGIDAVNSSTNSEDRDGPMTTSSGIDAVSLYVRLKSRK